MGYIMHCMGNDCVDVDAYCVKLDRLLNMSSFPTDLACLRCSSKHYRYYIVDMHVLNTVPTSEHAITPDPDSADN